MTTLSSAPSFIGPPTPAASWWTRHIAYPFRVSVARVGRVLIAWAAIGPSLDDIERGHQATFRYTVFRKFDELIDLQMEFRQILDERHGHLTAGLESLGASVIETRPDWSSTNEMLATLKAQGLARAAPSPRAADDDFADVPVVPPPLVFVDTQPLLLLAPDGTLEAEVGWHYAEIPVEREHQGRVYRRKHFANEAGHWEFVRA